MNQAITPTWATVELPLLQAIVQADLDGNDLDEAAHATGHHIGLTSEKTTRHLAALIDASYLTGEPIRNAGGELDYVTISAPTGAARRAVGQWPSEEQFLTDLAAALHSAADQQHDPEDAGALRRAARWISDFTSNAGANAAGTMLATLLARYTG